MERETFENIVTLISQFLLRYVFKILIQNGRTAWVSQESFVTQDEPGIYCSVIKWGIAQKRVDVCGNEIKEGISPMVKIGTTWAAD